MQAQHLGATLALYRLVKGQVRLFRSMSMCFKNHLCSNAYTVFCLHKTIHVEGSIYLIMASCTNFLFIECFS